MREAVAERRGLLWVGSVLLVAGGVAASTWATVSERNEDDRCLDRAFGCVETGADGPIRLATLLPLSGPRAELGQDARAGAELALELHGGRVLGHPVVLVHRDDGCATGRTVRASRLLAMDTPQQPPIAAVIGVPCTENTEPAAQILSDSGIPLVSWSEADVRFIDPPPERSFYVPLAPEGPDGVEAFASTYRERYGRDPTGPAAFEAYRATSLVLKAIGEVARRGATRGVLLPRTELRDVLRRLAG